MALCDYLITLILYSHFLGKILYANRELIIIFMSLEYNIFEKVYIY